MPHLTSSHPSCIELPQPSPSAASDNYLDYPQDAATRDNFHAATSVCQRSNVVCYGLPPFGCHAFGDYAVAIGQTDSCVRCHGFDWLGVLVVSTGALLVLLFVGAFLRAVYRWPFGIRHCVATCSIALSHLQIYSIIGSLHLRWPKLLDRVIAAIGFDLLRIPSISCLFVQKRVAFETQRQADRLPSQLWVFPFIVPGINLGILLILLAVWFVLIWRERHESRQAGSSPKAAAASGSAAVYELLATCERRRDNVEKLLSIIVSVPLATTWRSCTSLFVLVAHSLQQRAIDEVAGELVGGHATLPPVEHNVIAGLVIAPLLLVCQLALVLYFARQIVVFSRGLHEIYRSDGTGRWPANLPLPRRLDTRLGFLTGRYAKHAPRWELAIWLRLLALELVNLGLTLALKYTSGARSEAVATYASVLIAILVLAVAWWAHRRVRPYVLRRQNQLASLLFASEIALLVFGGLYQLVSNDVSAPATLQVIVEAILVGILVGGLVLAIVIALIDLRRTQRAAANMDLSEMELTVDKRHIDRHIAERLRDSTIRLLRTDWLANASESDPSLGREASEGQAILNRRQDLPERAFLAPEQAADLLDRGDRSILVLSYGGKSAARTRATAPSHLLASRSASSL